MSSTCVPAATQFGQHVLEGLSVRGGKRLSPRYFYDDLGSALFEAITLLPEYGLTRADERLLATCARPIAAMTGPLSCVVELGSGSGKKTLHVLREASLLSPDLTYRPIDVSSAALDACQKETESTCRVEAVCDDWMEGLASISQQRDNDLPLLLLFLGSSVGNLERRCLPDFLTELRNHLRSGDYFLLGADLVKDVDVMIEAYNDPTGVTAAFNLNLLGRMNRELETNFDLSAFVHEARWNERERRIEMHLLSCRDQRVESIQLGATFAFHAGETIWTESSHKFELSELSELAKASGFAPTAEWVDQEWPMAEVLWHAV